MIGKKSCGCPRSFMCECGAFGASKLLPGNTPASHPYGAPPPAGSPGELAELLDRAASMASDLGYLVISRGCLDAARTVRRFVRGDN